MQCITYKTKNLYQHAKLTIDLITSFRAAKKNKDVNMLIQKLLDSGQESIKVVDIDVSV